MKDEKEQFIELKDGRTLFKTHNGFKFWVRDKNGNETVVTEAYFKNALKHRKKQPKRK